MTDYEPIAERLMDAARNGAPDSASNVRLLMEAADAIRDMQELLEQEASRKSRLEMAWTVYRAVIRRDLDIDDPRT